MTFRSDTHSLTVNGLGIKDSLPSGVRIDRSMVILKRRAAVERWKTNNREYYLKQKRELASRPEYKAKLRARYHKQQAELREAGILPRKLGRPRLYDGEEAIEVRRQRAREATARYRMKKESLVRETNESTITNTNSTTSQAIN